MPTILIVPSSASVANHTTITGPNSRPTVSVPRFWIENRPTRMAAVIGSTQVWIVGAAISIPSTADSTEIAGVIIPSPYSRAVPKSPSITSERPTLPPRVISAVSARIPPSP